MTNTSELKAMSPEERETNLSQIRKILKLPDEAGEWEIIGTLTILAANLWTQQEQAIDFYENKISHREKGTMIAVHKQIKGLSNICKRFGWEVPE